MFKEVRKTSSSNNSPRIIDSSGYSSNVVSFCLSRTSSLFVLIRLLWVSPVWSGRLNNPKPSPFSTLVVESLQILNISCVGGILGTWVRQSEVEDCSWLDSGTVCGEGLNFVGEECCWDVEELFCWTVGECTCLVETCAKRGCFFSLGLASLPWPLGYLYCFPVSEVKRQVLGSKLVRNEVLKFALNRESAGKPLTSSGFAWFGAMPNYLRQCTRH